MPPLHFLSFSILLLSSNIFNLILFISEDILIGVTQIFLFFKLFSYFTFLFLLSNLAKFFKLFYLKFFKLFNYFIFDNILLFPILLLHLLLSLPSPNTNFFIYLFALIFYNFFSSLSSFVVVRYKCMNMF